MTSILELEQFAMLLSRCKDPEDLFGLLSGDSGTQLKQLKTHYRKGVNICHPDRCQNLGEEGKKLAQDTFKSLQQLFEEAEEKIKEGRYGTRKEHVPGGAAQPIIKTRKRKYSIISHLAEGDYASVYLAQFDDSDKGTVRVSIKIVRDKKDNDLMLREQRVLQVVNHKHLPVFVDEFVTAEGQRATIYEHLNGFDLTTIRQKYPLGVPLLHASWIFQRLLSGLSYLHEKKIFHGGITPDNILVRPGDHNVFLIDFLCSVIDPSQTDQFVAATDPYTAPEAYRKRPPIESSDLYSLGKCMIYLLGGDPSKNILPATIDNRFTKYLKNFVKTDPHDRPQNAAVSWNQLSSLRDEIFGKDRQFKPFKVT